MSNDISTYDGKIAELVKDFGSPEAVIRHIMEAAEAVEEDVEAVLTAKTIMEAGRATVSLRNSTSDLTTWLPYQEERYS